MTNIKKIIFYSQSYTRGIGKNKKQALKFSEDPRSGLLTHTQTHTQKQREREKLTSRA